MLKRGSTVEGLARLSSPLLKFNDNNEPYLHDEGMAKIRDITDVICPVILMGDGRAGKSYLASRCLDIPEVFISDDSAEPVTEGIDMVLMPRKKLLKKLGEADLIEQDERNPAHVLILDCEGGNNAMAAIRVLVDVFGILVGTNVMFVAGGSFSEAALEAMGKSLAARSLVKLDSSCRLPEQQLNFVVNKNTLNYKPDTLEKALAITEKTPAPRAELRRMVSEAFKVRKFFAIPLMGMPDFEDGVSALRMSIARDIKPLELGGAEVRGDSLTRILELILTGIKQMNEVNLPSMLRTVVYDGYLAPLIKTMKAEFAASLPALDKDYDPNLDGKDTRNATMATYDQETSQIDTVLAGEAREDLQAALDVAWLACKSLNDNIGEEVVETLREERSTILDEKKVPVGGKGMLANVQLLQQTILVEYQLGKVKKKGVTEWTDWQTQGGPSRKIQETAFVNFSVTVPSIKDSLLKQSPSKTRSILACVVDRFQERCVVVKEGHMVWWDDKSKDLESVAGAVNFMLDKAVVEPDANEALFRVKPANGDWSSAVSFGGGKQREFVFDATPSWMTRDEWVDVIQKNIDFANKAAEQLGVQRIEQEIGSDKPSVEEAMWAVKSD